MQWLTTFEDILHEFITIAIHGLELMGVCIVIIGALRAFYGYFFGHAPNVRLTLAQSMVTGLEFKLGGEILRTVIARDWNDILSIGALILVRAMLNFLLHWEINHIEQHKEHVERHVEVAGRRTGITRYRLRALGHAKQPAAHHTLHGEE